MFKTIIGVAFLILFLAAIAKGITKKTGEAGSNDPNQTENILEDHSKPIGPWGKKKE